MNNYSAIILKRIGKMGWYSRLTFYQMRRALLSRRVVRRSASQKQFGYLRNARIQVQSPPARSLAQIRYS